MNGTEYKASDHLLRGATQGGRGATSSKVHEKDVNDDMLRSDDVRTFQSGENERVGGENDLGDREVR